MMSDEWISCDEFCTKFLRGTELYHIIDKFFQSVIADDSDADDTIKTALKSINGTLVYGTYVTAVETNIKTWAGVYCSETPIDTIESGDCVNTPSYKLSYALSLGNYDDTMKLINSDDKVKDMWQHALVDSIVSAGISDVAIIVGLILLGHALDGLAAWVKAQNWIPQWIKDDVVNWINKGKEATQNTIADLEASIKKLLDSIAGNNELLKTFVDKGLTSLFDGLNKIGDIFSNKFDEGLGKLLDKITTANNHVIDGIQHITNGLATAFDGVTKSITQKESDNIDKLVGQMETNNENLINTMAVNYETMYASAESASKAFVGISMYPFTYTDPKTKKQSTYNLYELPIKVLAEMMITAGDPIDSYIKRLLEAVTGVMHVAKDPYTISASMISANILQSMKLQLAQMQALSKFDPKKYKETQKQMLQANQELKDDMMAHMKDVYSQIAQQRTKLNNTPPNTNNGQRGGF